jgi:heat shock protein HslJ
MQGLAASTSNTLMGALACGVAATAVSIAAHAADLTGRDWRVVTLAGFSGTVPEGATVRLETDGRFSGFAGCNRIVGRYRSIGGGRVAFDRPAATFKMCERNIMAFEDQFLKALAQDGVAGQIVGDEFHVSTSGTEPLLRFR